MKNYLNPEYYITFFIYERRGLRGASDRVATPASLVAP